MLPNYSPKVWHPFLLLPAELENVLRGVSYPNRPLFCSQSLIKRMAQSVVEVMEDAKGKVQENLLANGGRSLEGAYFCAFSAHAGPSVALAVTTRWWLKWHARPQPPSLWIDRGHTPHFQLNSTNVLKTCPLASVSSRCLLSKMFSISYHIAKVLNEIWSGNGFSGGLMVVWSFPCLSASSLSCMESSSLLPPPPNRFIPFPKWGWKMPSHAEECLRLTS